MKTAGQIKTYGPHFRYKLPNEPADSSQIAVKITHPKVLKGKRVKGIQTIREFDEFEYKLDKNRPIVVLDFGELSKILTKEGLKNSWPVNIEIAYPVK